MKKHPVLVVDDEPFNLEIIEEFLCGEPYILTMAEDGVEAWDILQFEPDKFSAILLDRMMPNMGGMELLAKLKAEKIYRHIPIILQTAKASSKDIMEGIKAGAHYYLTKPFDEDSLKSMLRSALYDYELHVDLSSKVDLCSLALQKLSRGEMHFTFRTLEDGKGIATLLSNLCPEPSQVVTGLNELVTNAVEHGCLGITYEEKTVLLAANGWAEEIEKRQQLSENQDKEVSIGYVKNDTHIKISIQDPGQGFDWTTYLTLDPSRAFDTHGRGIAMANLMSFDQITYHGCGNEVEAMIEL